MLVLGPLFELDSPRQLDELGGVCVQRFVKMVPGVDDLRDSEVRLTPTGGLEALSGHPTTGLSP
jgi:hypothetical protein